MKDAIAFLWLFVSVPPVAIAFLFCFLFDAIGLKMTATRLFCLCGEFVFRPLFFIYGKERE